jgi:hypothetical protein
MTKKKVCALAAAGLLAGFAASGASAADFGGDCCADLEERVAELEATTARKGNRKVSLTLSGFVAQQVMWWDDGFEDNVYITDTGSVSIGTHFAFSGTAQITPDVSAGFLLKLEAMTNDSLGVSQNNDDGGNVFAKVQGGDLISIESAYWFLKSESLGRLSVGQQSSAADNQALIVDGSGSLIQANAVLYDVLSFRIRRAGAPDNSTLLTWGDVGGCEPHGGGVALDCDGYPGNYVRYDTPTFAGFAASASWGEDDEWAVSGRYAGEFAGFKLAAAVAYDVSTDETIFGGDAIARANGGHDASAIQTGAYLEHVPTGLFVYGAYSHEYIDSSGTERAFTFGTEKPEGDSYYLKAGIRQRWTSLGYTVLYGEYGNSQDRFGDSEFEFGVTDSELQHYGVGIVQDVDAAAMQLWLAWRHYEAKVTCNDALPNADCDALGLVDGSAQGLKDFDLIKAGALIAF